MHKKLSLTAYLIATVLGLISQAGQSMENEKSFFMEKIPLEKKVEIFAWLPKESLVCVSTVCSDLRQIACTFNFHNIHFTAPFWAQDGDLQELTETFKNINILHLGLVIAGSGKLTSDIMNHLPKLHTLYIGANSYDASEGSIYKRQGYYSDKNINLLDQLRTLDLGNHTNGITNVGLEKLTNLTDLTLGWNNSITNDGISQMTNLIKLTLSCDCDSPIDEHGITSLTKLEYLHVPTSPIDCQNQYGFPARSYSFEEIISMPNLKTLYLRYCDDLDVEEHRLSPSLQFKWSLRFDEMNFLNQDDDSDDGY